MHEEYEIRFRLERNIQVELEGMGFRRKADLEMADLVFEPRDWRPGDMIAPGYRVVRVRLAHNRVPLIELKEFVRGNTWREMGVRTEDPAAFVRLLGSLMVPRRVIRKRREVWTNGMVEVSIDEVRHLGRFIEIEGPRMYADELALELGFRVEDREANYGSQLFYLEKTGLVPFRPDGMQDVLREFGF